MKGKMTFLAIEGEPADWTEAIRMCGDAIVQSGNAGSQFVQACLDREVEYPTGLPSEIPVAIPHGFSDDISEDTICLLRPTRPVAFRRMDDDEEICEAQLIFNIAIKASEDHLNFLQQLMAFAMNTERLARCLALSIDEVPEFLDSCLS